MSKTVICDIDGTLIQHKGNCVKQLLDKPELLEGTLEKFIEWDRKGYNIILITGRRESTREATENQLSSLGIFYDQLIMGVDGGCRVLINDLKSGSTEATASSINIERNKGIKDVEI